ncbi:unnamed protein product [Orchesella dallaii]|uniref:Uncharacterized protein n=1 Tax=Orchesella dallaii TaxID=48710 RepID=A0ABP1R0J7_9HEXA
MRLLESSGGNVDKPHEDGMRKNCYSIVKDARNDSLLIIFQRWIPMSYLWNIVSCNLLTLHTFFNHKSTSQFVYKAMLGRPVLEDGNADTVQQDGMRSIVKNAHEGLLLTPFQPWISFYLLKTRLGNQRILPELLARTVQYRTKRTVAESFPDYFYREIWPVNKPNMRIFCFVFVMMVANFAIDGALGLPLLSGGYGVNLPQIYQDSFIKNDTLVNVDQQSPISFIDRVKNYVRKLRTQSIQSNNPDSSNKTIKIKGSERKPISRFLSEIMSGPPVLYGGNAETFQQRDSIVKDAPNDSLLATFQRWIPMSYLWNIFDFLTLPERFTLEMLSQFLYKTMARHPELNDEKADKHSIAKDIRNLWKIYSRISRRRRTLHNLASIPRSFLEAMVGLPVHEDPNAVTVQQIGMNGIIKDIREGYLPSPFEGWMVPYLLKYRLGIELPEL